MNGGGMAGDNIRNRKPLLLLLLVPLPFEREMRDTVRRSTHLVFSLPACLMGNNGISLATPASTIITISVSLFVCSQPI